MIDSFYPLDGDEWVVLDDETPVVGTPDTRYDTTLSRMYNPWRSWAA
jgi:hypothetical protein